MAEGPPAGKSDSKSHAPRSPQDARLHDAQDEVPRDRKRTAPPPGSGVDSEDDLQDRMLGEFRILRRLGRGGMAEVYLAEQTSLKRNVAIKVLRRELVTDESYLTRFKTEAM